MIKPTLEQFNLTEPERDRVKAHVLHLGWLCAGLAVLVIAVRVYMMGISVWLILAFIWVPLIVASIPHIWFEYSDINKRLTAFEAATRDYEIWLEETQRELARRKREFWTSLTGPEFEVEVARLYEKLGYKCALTAASGDGGIDIVLVRNEQTTIVQCKQHKKPVGPHTIRDLYGTLINANADEAILVSVSGFTSGVVEYAVGKRITLISLEDLINMIET